MEYNRSQRLRVMTAIVSVHQLSWTLTLSSGYIDMNKIKLSKIHTKYLDVNL